MFSSWPALQNGFAPGLETNPQLKAFLEDRVINAEEDYIARLEGDFVPILDALRGRDLRFYDDAKQSGLFFYFVSLQWLRTKGIRQRLLNAPKWPGGYDPARCWGVLRHIFASNIGQAFS